MMYLEFVVDVDAAINGDFTMNINDVTDNDS